MTFLTPTRPLFRQAQKVAALLRLYRPTCLGLLRTRLALPRSAFLVLRLSGTRSQCRLFRAWWQWFCRVGRRRGSWRGRNAVSRSRAEEIAQGLETHLSS